ncbi:amidase family protein [Komagataeibacter rhaeticus]|nr:amidase family protein [Komagataeibacter rhaeticus]
MVAALAEALIEAIDLTEPTLGAWHCFDPEYLRLQARQLDARPHKGRLHGLPVGIKDVIDTHDLPTGYGSRHYEGTRPASDAGCVAMLRAEGALIVGKTVSTEFAFVAPGKTRNPYDPAHTPGGSSSGSAAAVGAGWCRWPLSTQTSGSTIRPAAFCGIVGYKPSYGLIDRTGIKVLCETLDTVGLLGWRVADVALVASVLAQRPLEAQAETAAQSSVLVCSVPCSGMRRHLRHLRFSSVRWNGSVRPGMRLWNCPTPVTLARLWQPIPQSCRGKCPGPWRMSGWEMAQGCNRALMKISRFLLSRQRRFMMPRRLWPAVNALCGKRP